eukprot:scaffold19425_cov129-Isochrysis_galbana.AAC.3
MVYNWSDTMHSTMKPILSRSILLVICPRSVVRISSTRSTGEPRRRYFAWPPRKACRPQRGGNYVAVHDSPACKQKAGSAPSAASFWLFGGCD